MEGGGSPKNRYQKQIKLGIKNIFSHKAARNAASFVAKTNNSRFLSPWVTKAVLTQNLKELVGGWWGRALRPPKCWACRCKGCRPTFLLPSLLASRNLLCQILLFTDKASFFLASFPSLPAAFLPPSLPSLPSFLSSFLAFLPCFLPLLPLLIGSMLISFLMAIIFFLMPIIFFLMPISFLLMPIYFWCVSPAWMGFPNLHVEMVLFTSQLYLLTSQSSSTFPRPSSLTKPGLLLRSIDDHFESSWV